MRALAAIATVALLGAGVAAAQERPAFVPVTWDAPAELRALLEQHLPPPLAEARLEPRQDRPQPPCIGVLAGRPRAELREQRVDISLVERELVVQRDC